MLAVRCLTPSSRYDGEFFDASNSFLMQLYDVGMSSMLVQEAYALAELALAIGRDDDAMMLRDRGDSMSSKIRDELWDPQSNIFCACPSQQSAYLLVLLELTVILHTRPFSQ